MSTARKRQRTGEAIPRTTKRAIDKELKVVNQVATTAVVSTVLKTTTFPCTVVGLRWDGVIDSITAAASALTSWAIIVVHDGNAPNTPSLSDGGNYYTPEQDVLAFGITRTLGNTVTAGPRAVQFSGSTKTMRKLKQGDQLMFITFAGTAISTQVDAIIQFFCKV